MFFQCKYLISEYQDAYRKGYSLATALTQMSNDWLRCTEEKKTVGAVVLAFTAAFDIINHEILLKKLECYGFVTVLSLTL